MTEGGFESQLSPYFCSAGSRPFKSPDSSIVCQRIRLLVRDLAIEVNLDRVIQALREESNAEDFGSYRAIRRRRAEFAALRKRPQGRSMSRPVLGQRRLDVRGLIGLANAAYWIATDRSST
jgi:hypothetical protein